MNKEIINYENYLEEIIKEFYFSLTDEEKSEVKIAELWCKNENVRFNISEYNIFINWKVSNNK